MRFAFLPPLPPSSPPPPLIMDPYLQVVHDKTMHQVVSPFSNFQQCFAKYTYAEILKV